MSELDELSIFVSVAGTRSFRATAEQVGVSRSAVSQAMQRLEARLGVALVQRTSRSVSLTEAGRELHGRVAPALGEVAAAMERTRSATRPSGVLRLAVSSIADGFLAGPLLARFTEAHPEVVVDVTVTDDEFDIVDRGYDAGVRLGEMLDQDVIAVRASGEQRQIVVAAPGYLARHPAPSHPRDLVGHRCIGWRPSPDVAPYRWEFTEDGRDFDVAVRPVVTTNDMRVLVRTALAGGGLTCGLQETFQDHLDRGGLVQVLGAYCPVIPGFFLYYPARRNLAPKIRALVDHLKTWRWVGNVDVEAGLPGR